VIWGREVTGRPEVSTKSDDIVDLVKRYDGRFSGLHGVGLPAPGTIGDVLARMREALAKPGMIGVTVDAQTALPPQPYSDDPRYYPVYELCEQLGGILALTMSRGNEIWDNILYASPEALDRIAGDFPNLDIVVSHACWPWVVQGCGVCFRRPNVYLLPDLYGLPMPGYLVWVQAANTYMADQLIFGSAYPRLGVEEVASGYRDLPFKDDAVRRKVMFENAERLLSKQGVKLN
jgi:predicted TIM-barrel fold metal-dependent hydrolase